MTSIQRRGRYRLVGLIDCLRLFRGGLLEVKNVRRQNEFERLGGLFEGITWRRWRGGGRCHRR